MIKHAAQAAIYAGLVAAVLGVPPANAQSRNNPYSPSPDKRASALLSSQAQVSADDSVTFRLQLNGGPSKGVVDRPAIAQAVYKRTNDATEKPAVPSETYKIGIGDVLFVGLKNAATGSGYYTVRADGTIDYPLAGENVAVAGQPVDLAGEIIASGIKLFASPDVQVKIREFASHRITVTGAVENAGSKSLQREAMPLFAIRAEAVPGPGISKVRIKRAGSTGTEVIDLRDAASDETLIFPGDDVYFFGESNTTGTYFIGGEVMLGGQKDLLSGLTLYQAIVASGGAKGDPRKAFIRRKNEKGMLTVTEHNLRSIKDGRAMDPFLATGDIVEIKN